MISPLRIAATLLNAGLLLACATGLAHAQNLTSGEPATGAVRYVENRGQIVDAEKHARPDILYLTQSHDVAAYLRTTGLSYVFVKIDGGHPPKPDPSAHKPFTPRFDSSVRVTTYRMDMDLVGANTAARVEGQFPSQDYANFYLSQCPNGITNVRAYDRVIYHDIYPKIDLVYYGSGGAMKYDFVVHPGGRVADIVMRYTGASELHRTERGSVAVANPLGMVEEGRPEMYQGADSKRMVSGTYAVADREIRFDVGAYDHARDLVIDPTLLWSTYFGGTNYEYGWGWGGGGWGGWGWGGGGCKTDRDTTITFVGSTLSTDFPVTPGAFQSGLANGASQYDGYVVRLSHRGARLWATYYGGNSWDWAGGVAVDARRNAYVTFGTYSSDFPTTPGVYQRTPNPGLWEGAIVKLDSLGHQVWGTFYNGTDISGIAVDSLTNVYVGGAGTSVASATPGAFQATPPPASQYTGILTKFNSSGSARIWSTYFGGTQQVIPGSSDDILSSIALDRGANIFICGTTGTLDFPFTAGAFQAANRGGIDGFVAKFDSAGNRIWATYYGGNYYDFASDLAVDSHSNVTVIGTTLSANLVTSASAFQSHLNGTDYDIWIARFDSSGTNKWSTYYGGSGYDYGTGIDVDPLDRIWFIAYTSSTDFPITGDAYQATMRGIEDAGVVKMDTNGARIWGTYMGGTQWDYAEGIATNPYGCVITGETYSADYPTTAGAFQVSQRGGSDAFISMFCDPSVTVDVNGPLRFCAGDSVVLTVPLGYDTYTWSNGATATNRLAVKQSGTYTVTASVIGCSATSLPVYVRVDSVVPRSIVPHVIQLCAGDSVTFQIPGHQRVYRWSTGDTTATITIRAAGNYSLAYIDSNGCSAHTDTATVTVAPNPSTAITPAGPISFCNGGSAILDAGPGFAEYRWSTGETSQTIAVHDPGTYQVRVKNSYGCWSQQSNVVRVIVFPLPTPVIRNLLPTTFCEGDSTILAVTPSNYASYLWSTGARTPMITVKTEGVYTVTVTDSNGCTGTAQKGVKVTPRPVLKISANGPLTFCEGDSVTLSASGFLLYQWSNGSQDAQIVVKQPGKYFVTVTSDKGCVGWSDTVVVAVKPLPSPAISGPVRVCRDALANYSAQSGGS
ncbi:MAG TPA: SBBP repeat-containing protein, partial [Candidatus Kapabacteria bacterium]|nr:SBBP repeat-containing protein [Candidatus Kapabacteria bacterium]